MRTGLICWPAWIVFWTAVGCGFGQGLQNGFWHTPPWFTVADNDVFPEEFHKFLGMPADLREVFGTQHGDLYTVKFWRDLQDRHRSGDIPDFYPYEKSKRLDLR